MVEDRDTPPVEQWRLVDEGWGRRAVEFATLAEPLNVREYATMHRRLGVAEGDRLLDVACGSGLALELAAILGARCAGIDASPRLIAVARDRSPGADVRVGDMNALPWEEGSFDVVTSFRGIWGTTPDALVEAHRVLAPGGRIGLTVWGHIKASPGAWALAPFALADEPKVRHQADMVALGRPGAGEAQLEAVGFEGIRRTDVDFVWEFADPESFARVLASSGPAFEAIQDVGEDAFHDAAVELGRQHLRDGLPLRASIKVVGFLARKAASTPSRLGGRAAGEDARRATFLSAPPDTSGARRLADEDVRGMGYVSNVSRLWGHHPGSLDGYAALLGEIAAAGSLTYDQRCVLVTAAASTIEDSYCAMAWGKRLAEARGPEVAAAVIRGESEGLDSSDAALARWARLVATDPNRIAATDVDALRTAGFDDAAILAITQFIALRVAFSTVNDALGAAPDRELEAATPSAVREAVTFGRPSDDGGEPQGAGGNS